MGFDKLSVDPSNNIKWLEPNAAQLDLQKHRAWWSSVPDPLFFWEISAAKSAWQWLIPLSLFTGESEEKAESHLRRMASLRKVKHRRRKVQASLLDNKISCA